MLKRWFVAILVLLNCHSVVCAQERYVFQNNDISVDIDWGIDSTGRDSILLRLKPLNDIFISDEDDCFGYADIIHQVQFENACGTIVDGKRIYIIDGLTCCKFRSLPKDSIQSYKWKAAKGEEPFEFRFHFSYVGSREYALKNNCNRRKHTSGTRILTVSSQEMDKFHSSVRFQIPSPQICTRKKQN